MSDNARESFTSKASNSLKPDSQKSSSEQLTDTLKSKADSLASSIQPQSQKSTTQKAGDAASKNDKSMLDSAKDAAGMSSK